jgi:uncharacterized protein (TIGR00255 family)
MTGFGQSAGENERYRVTVSVRTVNHRLLDISLRLPDELRAMEGGLRKRIAGRIRRGRVEVRVDLETLGSRDLRVAIEEGVLLGLRAQVEELAERDLIQGELTLTDLLTVPGALTVNEPPRHLQVADESLLGETLENALGQVLTARETEGEELAAKVRTHLGKLDSELSEIEARRTIVQGELDEKVRRRMAAMLDGEGLPDEQRIAQEIAILLERGDVQEELDRLRSHLSHFEYLLEEEESVGRKMDFLAQEIFRELTTLGAKCRDSETSQRVIEGKLLCEQIREQVQNLE